MKRNRYIGLVIALVILSGCEPPVVFHTLQDGGTIEEINLIGGSWTYSARTQILTEKGSFTIRGTDFVIPLHVPIVIGQTDNQGSWMTWTEVDIKNRTSWHLVMGTGGTY